MSTRNILVAAAVAVAAAAVVAAPASAARGKNEFASAAGSGSACTAKKPCTLAQALKSATAGTTVHVRSGRYSGGVAVDKKIRLLAQGRVLIDASSSADGTGIHVVGPGGSGAVVQGFVVENAKYEGILVGTSPGDAHPQPVPVHGVVIRNNIVEYNDKGIATQDGECKDNPPTPGDCGEGLHLSAATGTVVENNVVAYNAGGILLTDEFGPTAHDTIRNNRVLNNLIDCGITLAGHSGAAVDPKTGQRTGKAGVFDNLIEDNLSRNNGVMGEGGGILLGSGAPGSGVYGNVIRNNTAEYDGLSGITIHQHFAADMNDNTIEGNTVRLDNSLGDHDFDPPDLVPTGILVASGAPPGANLPPFLLPGPVNGTVIKGNTISDVQIGIWTFNAPGDYSDNTFASNVSTQVSNH